MLNKIAGVYGVIAVFAGGTFAQISMYAYSIATLAVFLWGLKSIGEARELPPAPLTGAGEPLADADFRPPLHARPPRLDDLDGRICRHLVVLHAARWSSGRQLVGAGGPDANTRGER